MANSLHDPVIAQLERQKLTLIASLSSVAEQMRHCANVADQFAQMLTQAPINEHSLVSPILPGATHAGSKRHGTEEEEIDGSTKKRRVANKKTRDPDAPKRAASSYIFFQNDLRQELRKQHPDISPAEIMARVSKQWAEMMPEQKAPYERLQAEAKQKWEAEKRAYDERRGVVAPITKPAGRGKAAATTAGEEPVHPVSAGSIGTKLARKSPESSDSSTDTNSSDKSEGEEEGAGGNSDEEDEDEDEKMEEEPLAPPRPQTKSKGKSKTEINVKPKSKVSSAAILMPARQEKKKRSKA